MYIPRLMPLPSSSEPSQAGWWKAWWWLTGYTVKYTKELVPTGGIWRVTHLVWLGQAWKTFIHFIIHIPKWKFWYLYEIPNIIRLCWWCFLQGSRFNIFLMLARCMVWCRSSAGVLCAYKALWNTYIYSATLKLNWLLLTLRSHCKQDASFKRKGHKDVFMLQSRALDWLLVKD